LICRVKVDEEVEKDDDEAMRSTSERVGGRYRFLLLDGLDGPAMG